MEDPTKAWTKMVSNLYPDMATQTYVVPPVHFNRVPYRKTLVPGTKETALVLHYPDDTTPTTPDADNSSSRVQESSAFETDVLSSGPYRGMLWDPTNKCTGPQKKFQATDLQDDFAQTHVLTNLKAFSEKKKKAMFILSQLSFGQYLNRPAYHAAVEMLGLPLPKDLDTKAVHYSRGEVDIVVFHPRHGVLIGEIKSVGRLHDTTPIIFPVGLKVAERITKAIKQLERSEKVISHLVSDIAPRLTVRKTLFLPYVLQEQLVRTLCLKTVLNESLCKCLGASDMYEAVDLCVCADQLSDPDTYCDVTPADDLSKLSTWWQHRMATDDPLLCKPGSGELYLDIVSRFVGPASTIGIYTSISPRLEVRTAEQAVAELGQRLSRLVLTPQQLDILTRDPSMVCYTGPPGTGKTLMLALQGLRRLREGKDVHIVSTDDDTLAASYLIEYQLNMTLQSEAASESISGTNFGAVKMHHFDFRNAKENIVDDAITELKTHIRQSVLCVIMDEVSFHDSVTAGPRCRRLLEGLRKLQDDQKDLLLYVGCACMDHGEGSGLKQREKLTLPLRCAPAIVRQVRKIMHVFQDVSDYHSDGYPAPGEGLSVVKLCHEGEHHEGLWPVECPQCGRDVAVELRRLGVGAATTEAPLSPQLRWGDVFVITRSSKLQDDVRDTSGHVVSPACGFVRGLREQGVPVSVLCGGFADSSGDSDEDRRRRHRRIQDVAIGRCAEVTAANGCFLDSMERRVVVWLVYSFSTDRDDMVRLDARDRLFKVSRCTTQLISVVTPAWVFPLALRVSFFVCVTSENNRALVCSTFSCTGSSIAGCKTGSLISLGACLSINF